VSLQTQIQALISAVATDIVALTTTRGNMSNLTTTNKTSLVAALNELKAAMANAAGIDDNAGSSSTTATWSASKITSAITAAINALVAGAPTALDTLNELAEALQNEQSSVSAITTALANKVDFANTQSLTTAQQAKACANIGIGDPEFDFAAAYNSAKT
jgi:hypothetical protein